MLDNGVLYVLLLYIFNISVLNANDILIADESV